MIRDIKRSRREAEKVTVKQLCQAEQLPKVRELKSDNIEPGGVVPLPGGWKGIITGEVEKIGSSKPERGKHERTD